MAFIISDRVLETWTGTGLLATTAITLSGAAVGYKTFLAGIGSTNTCYYTVQHPTTSEWETCIGTVDATGKITKTTFDSSSTGSAVTFTAGTKYVFSAIPASKSVYVDDTKSIQNTQSATAATSNYFKSTATSTTGLTLTTINHFAAAQGTLTSVPTNQIGFLADSTLTTGTNNYGFYGNLASGTNKWNLYMPGTATNYLKGSTGIGTNTITAPLTVAGPIALNAPSVVSGATYTQLAADSTLIFTVVGTCTITLLAASSYTGQILYLKSGTTSGTTTVTSASNNIVQLNSISASNSIIASTGKYTVLQSDGTNWQIISQA